MCSLLSAFALIALLASYPADSFKFTNNQASPQILAAPADHAAYSRDQQNLRPAQPLQYEPEQQHQQQQQLDKLATKGAEQAPSAAVPIKSEPAIIQEQIQQHQQAEPATLQAHPEPARFAPVSLPATPLAPVAPIGYPMTYYILRPVNQQYSYQQLRYAQRPEYHHGQRHGPLVAAAPAVSYEQAAPIAQVHEHPVPVGAPLNAAGTPAYTREVDAGEPVVATKTGKFAKLKGSLEKALGLFSFGSYHVAKEEQFLPPQPATLLMQSPNQQFQHQQQEQVRDLDQQNYVQEQTRDQQGIPIEQHQQQQTLQNEVLNWSASRQQATSHNHHQQQHASQTSQEIDSNGFKRSSFY